MSEGAGSSVSVGNVDMKEETSVYDGFTASKGGSISARGLVFETIQEYAQALKSREAGSKIAITGKTDITMRGLDTSALYVYGGASISAEELKVQSFGNKSRGIVVAKGGST